MLKRFELETLIKAAVVVGILFIVVIALVFLVGRQPALIPIVVTVLLGLLTTVVSHYFPRQG
jgi:uncharacterized membrane protein (UPF0136 family)